MTDIDESEAILADLERALFEGAGEMDLADVDDQASLCSKDARGLQESLEDIGAPYGEDDDAGEDVAAGPMPAASTEADAVAEEFARLASLGDDAGEQDVEEGEAAGHPPEPPPAPPPPEIPLWEQLSDPGPLGYCYLNGRIVLRVLRGKPKNSVTVTCYNHRSCHLTLTEARCPRTDHELKWWVFELPETPRTAPAEQRRADADAHMKLGYARWGAPKRGG